MNGGESRHGLGRLPGGGDTSTKTHRIRVPYLGLGQFLGRGAAGQGTKAGNSIGAGHSLLLGNAGASSDRQGASSDVGGMPHRGFQPLILPLSAPASRIPASALPRCPSSPFPLTPLLKTYLSS